MVTLTAKTPHRYGAQTLEAGDRYEASAMHAKVLIAIGRAAAAPQSDPAPDEAVDDAADEAAVERHAAKKAKKAGTYETRDMKAED